MSRQKVGTLMAGVFATVLSAAPTFVNSDNDTFATAKKTLENLGTFQPAIRGIGTLKLFLTFPEKCVIEIRSVRTVLGQQSVERRVYRLADVDPGSVGIEHGTGLAFASRGGAALFLFEGGDSAETTRTGAGSIKLREFHASGPVALPAMMRLLQECQ